MELSLRAFAGDPALKWKRHRELGALKTLEDRLEGRLKGGKGLTLPTVIYI